MMRTGRKKLNLTGKTPECSVERKLATKEAIMRGLEDAKEGRVVPHDIAMGRLRATILRASIRKS
jgi:predicted transcriptional regulator